MERGHLAAIEVEELQAGYGRTDVLDGIDLAVTAGEFVAILGSSACGRQPDRPLNVAQASQQSRAANERVVLIRA